MHPILRHVLEGTDDLLDGRGIDIHPAHDDHVIRAAKDAAFKGKFAPSAGAWLSVE